MLFLFVISITASQALSFFVIVCTGLLVRGLAPLDYIATLSSHHTEHRYVAMGACYGAHSDRRLQLYLLV